MVDERNIPLAAKKFRQRRQRVKFHIRVGYGVDDDVEFGNIIARQDIIILNKEINGLVSVHVGQVRIREIAAGKLDLVLPLAVPAQGVTAIVDAPDP